MIEISCHGGRIGRFWWENSDRGGLFLRSGECYTSFCPGRCGWDETWPEQHAWPVMPWGKGDADDCWRDFAAFELWYQDQLAKRKLDEIDLTITEKIELYVMLVDIFHAGIDAGRNPWSWAEVAGYFALYDEALRFGRAVLARFALAEAPEASNFDPRLIALATTSEQIPPGPYSEHELRTQWDAQADEHNQWGSLDSSEQLAWAQARAIAADRNGRPATPPAQGPAPDKPAESLAARRLLEKLARLDDSVGITVAEVRQLADHAAAWLRETPPGQPVAIESRGCPTPGACFCVVPVAPPAPEVGEVKELVRRLRDWYSIPLLSERERAATLLQQLSAPAPAVVPVAVSERLPGKGDCDEDGFCWMGYGYRLPGENEKDQYARWMLMPLDESNGEVWLPAHAIPLPQAGEVQS
jgi:hypothetical protein